MPGRLREEPDAHLRHDAEVRLGEHRVVLRAVAVLGQLRRLAVGHRAHPGAHDVAVGQHDLQAALDGEVVAVRRVPDAAFHRVADDAAPREVGHVEPELRVVLAQVPGQVEEADARLDQRVAEGLVDFEYPVHPAQVEHDGAGHARRGGAEAEILAARDRRERDAELGGGLDDVLDVLHRARQERGGRSEVLRVEDGEGVAVVGQARGFVGDDVLRAEPAAERGDGRVEALTVNPGGNIRDMVVRLSSPWFFPVVLACAVLLIRLN